MLSICKFPIDIRKSVFVEIKLLFFFFTFLIDVLIFKSTLKSLRVA